MLAARSPVGENGRLSSIEPGTVLRDGGALRSSLAALATMVALFGWRSAPGGSTR
jgi:hypothetical protein